MVCAIPSGKLNKIWAVILGGAFFLLFNLLTAYFDLLLNTLFPYHDKFSL